jgi:hypothetical protein
VIPEQSLRLARGGETTSSSGQLVKLLHPLAWLAIADHSDALGLINEVIAGKAELMRDPVLKTWNQQMNAGGEEAMAVVMDIIGRQSNGTLPKAVKSIKMAAVSNRWEIP